MLYTKRARTKSIWMRALHGLSVVVTLSSIQVCGMEAFV